jgi:cytochrome c oxidase cbb3-type subunit 3
VLAKGELKDKGQQRYEYEKEMKIGEAIKQESIAKFEAGVEALTPTDDEAVLLSGKSVYDLNCAACHRLDGGGLVGPNLCDDYWIHGSNYVDNVKTIINGVPAKGMLTWRGVLTPDQIKAVSSYIYTMRGTTPPNPKPPENTLTAPTGPSEFE